MSSIFMDSEYQNLKFPENYGNKTRLCELDQKLFAYLIKSEKKLFSAYSWKKKTGIDSCPFKEIPQQCQNIKYFKRYGVSLACKTSTHIFSLLFHYGL